jgi:hypothetical protein
MKETDGLKIVAIVFMLFIIVGALNFLGVIDLSSLGFKSALVPAAIEVFSGGSVMSLSQVQIVSSSPQIGCGTTSCKVWLANLRITGKGQSLVGGTFTKEQIDDPNVKDNPTKPLSIDSQMESQKCIYPLYDSLKDFLRYSLLSKSFSLVVKSGAGVSICRYDINGGVATNYDTIQGIDLTPLGCLIKIDVTSFNNGYQSECQAIGGVPTKTNNPSNLDKPYWYCQYTVGTGVGSLFQLSSPSLYWNVSLKFSNGDVVEYLKLNRNTPNAMSAQGDVLAVYAGSVISDASTTLCPQTNPVSIIVSGATGSLISHHDDVPYFNAASYSGSEHQAFISAVDAFNAVVNAMITPNLQTLNPDFQTATLQGISSCTIDETSNPVAWQDLQLFIKADFLGIRIPATKPKFVSGTNFDFQSGAQGSFTATVQNLVGGDAGTFTVSAVCPSPAQVTDSPQQTQGLAPGATQTLTFHLTGTAMQQDVTGITCAITVTDSSNPLLKDTGSVTGIIRSVCTEVAVPPWVIVRDPITGVCTKVCGLKESDCSPGTTFNAATCSCLTPTPTVTVTPTPTITPTPTVSPTPTPTPCTSDAQCVIARGTGFKCVNGACVKEGISATLLIALIIFALAIAGVVVYFVGKKYGWFK